MKSVLCAVVIASSMFLSGNGALATEQNTFHNGLSMQGFTGILNTPSAHVTREGDFYALYSNQEESKWRKKTPFQDNYLFSVGLFDFVELGGRFFEAPSAGRDLSANIKITSAPLTQNYPLLPVIAAGIQDIGGGATLLRTKYLVASEDIWRLRLSLGYGGGPDRMDGIFAGAEFKAHDWVYLLGEYDTQETNLGIRAVIPPFWKIPFSFTATAKTSLDYKPGDVEIGVGFSVPLDFSMPASKPLPSTHEQKYDKTAPEKTVPAASAPSSSASQLSISNSDSSLSSNKIEKTSPTSADKCMADIRDRLIQNGFLNVRVGQRASTLLVEYENARYNHNELDALGMVAGIAASSSEQSDFDDLQIVVRKRDIAMISVGTKLDSLRTFLNGHSPTAAFRDGLSFSQEFDSKGVTYVGGDQNTNILKTSLMLSPGLTTWVGTEVGVFDYLLSLKPELTVPVWKGGVINARWDIPLLWSDNLENGKAFRGNRNDSRMERLMLFQGVRLFPSVMANIGAGMLYHDTFGTLNELTWTPGDGNHRIRLSQGWTEQSRTHKQDEVFLGSYRYYFAPLDLSLEATAGKFLAQDRGFVFELKRFFGDTAVSAYYKNSTATDSKKWEAAGIMFSFPLTPRRDMKPGILQVRGADMWTYAQETTLKNNNFANRRGNLNYFAPYPLTVTPQPTVGLLQTYQNRDRLNAAYIRQHLDRMRDSWESFGGK